LLKKRKIPIDEATSRLFLQGLSLAYWPAVKTSGATCTGAPIMLIVFAGLPASGKSSIARVLAQELGAVWLRIDSIEQAIRESGAVPGSLDDAGYRAAYAVAEDNLRLGRTVIGDSVNPWMLTRNAWRDAGLRAGARRGDRDELLGR
jgi:hypothetical protein